MATIGEAAIIMRRVMQWIGLVALGALLLALLAAPYAYAELMGWLSPHAIVKSKPVPLARGRMAGDYWAVERLNAGTFAIGEPRYYQLNYAYLIVGEKEALLFDAGSGTRDIRAVVRGLTALPVTVIASHLHYDHLGGIAGFRSIAMIDLPETRADVRGGVFVPGRYEFLGMIDGLALPRFRVSRWIRPGSWIDLGGRRVRLLSTPGHTPTSASLYDPAFRQVFVGDYLYPGPLYVQLPGARRSAYRTTATTLLDMLPVGTTIWAAHCCRKEGGVRAPYLAVNDVAALRDALDGIAAGRLAAQGFYPRVYQVNRQISFMTSFLWNNR
jgi:glyoxylase-like metal-dependent hydrolase (beta-lactamase superfamily II)